MENGINTYKSEEEKIKECKKKSIIGLILGLVPIVLFVFCLIVSGGDVSENGSGSVFWVLIIYGWTLAIPLAIISIVNSTKAVKINKNPLSISSLIVSYIPAIAIAVLIIFIFFPTMKSEFQKFLPNSDSNYIIKSRSNPNESLSIPSIGNSKLDCDIRDSLVFCRSEEVEIQASNAVGSYIDKANAFYKVVTIDNKAFYDKVDKIDCIDDAVCYILELSNDPINKNKEKLVLFVKGSNDNEHYKIDYKFNRKKEKEYKDKILKEIHFME